MATLEKIRKNGLLLAIVIGGALLAFVLGDMVKSGKSLLGNSALHVAVVNNKSVDINKYQNDIYKTEEYVKVIRGVKNLDEQTSQQLRANVWDMTLREKILEDTYEQLGLEISQDELKDMVLGDNIHPMVYQTFVNPQTGQFDKNIVINILQNLEQDQQVKSIWLYIESYIKKERVYTKYVSLVKKGLYVTKLEVAEDNNDRKNLVDIDLIGKTIADIGDDQISYTDKDLQKYYDEHKHLFVNKEESRDILYVTFDVVPSEADSLVVLKKAEAVKEDLQNTDNEQSIVNVRSSNPQMVRYFSKKELEASEVDSVLFNTAIGEVYGPYLKYGTYNLAKVVGKEERPDTVSARHILISPSNQKVGSMLRAHEIADSLVTVLNNGGDFSLLVSMHSDDSGSKDKGGLYENITEGQMVTEFNDYCFSHKVGELGTVETQYGVHIVEVTEIKSLETKIKVAFIQFSIAPSQATYDKAYSEAMSIRGQITDAASFTKVIEDNKIIIREAPDVNPGVYTIPGLDKVRDVVKWAFESKQGDVSNVIEMPDKYVIALLKNINEIGFLTLDKVKLQIVNSVKQEKKVEKIYNDFFADADINNMDALASKINAQKLSIPKVSFNAFQLATIGYEPIVLATVLNMKVNETKGPIKGTNGVYVIKATNVVKAPELSPQELVMQQIMMIQTLKSRADYQAFSALKNAADIEDRRASFF